MRLLHLVLNLQINKNETLKLEFQRLENFHQYYKKLDIKTGDSYIPKIKTGTKPKISR